MKREILFKAKLIDNGKWVEGFYLKTGKYYPEEEHLIARDESKVNMFALDYFPINPETICQFTGLLDKNGQKVFEGDVLTNGKGESGEVVHYEAGYALLAKRKNGSVWYMPLTAGFLKNKQITKNIYD